MPEFQDCCRIVSKWLQFCCRIVVRLSVLIQIISILIFTCAMPVLQDCYRIAARFSTFFARCTYVLYLSEYQQSCNNLAKLQSFKTILQQSRYSDIAHVKIRVIISYVSYFSKYILTILQQSYCKFFESILQQSCNSGIAHVKIRVNNIIYVLNLSFNNLATI